MTQDTRGTRLSAWIPSALFVIAIIVTCLWVLSLPVFPSQDGPLHLYYINAFRQVLAHQPGVYASTFSVRTLFPPYATYYYGLILLGKVFSLEMADKLFLCFAMALFAVSTLVLIRTVGGRTGYLALFVLPVMFNWTATMGFVNYFLGTSLACLGLAAWCAGVNRPELRYRIGFLLCLAAIALTHPIPWSVAVGFAGFEIAVRWLRGRYLPETGQPRYLGRDLVTLAVGCTPYFYFARFKVKTQSIAPLTFDPATKTWVMTSPEPYRHQVKMQVLNLVKTRGLDIFRGAGDRLPYRLGIDLVAVIAFAVALLYFVRTWKERRGREWQMADTWLLFTIVLLPCLVFVPDNFGGGYFFVTRLQLVLYFSCLVSASVAFQHYRKLEATVGVAAFLLSLYTVGLGQKYIAPISRDIAQLFQAPLVPANGRAGLAMRPTGIMFPHALNYEAYYWAPAHYFRRNNLLMYNTAWLGDRIIPLAVRPERLGTVDATYFNQDPFFPTLLLSSQDAARAVLSHVGFLVLVRQNTPLEQNPLADVPGGTSPAPYGEGWQCANGTGKAWYLCRPTRTEDTRPGEATE